MNDKKPIESKCGKKKKESKRMPEPDELAPDVIKQTVLMETNHYRRMHCACPLTLHPQLSKYAQKWANFLSANNLLETRSKPRFGESILRAEKSLCHVPDLIKLWYQEKYNYKFLDPGFSLYTGHFTQLVWRNTQYLGVGVAEKKNRIWIVCNYCPMGNIQGHYKENVLPRKLMISDTESDNDEQIKKSKSGCCFCDSCPFNEHTKCS